MRRVLVVDDALPEVPIDGGAVRMARLLELLAADGFSVVAAAPGAVDTPERLRLGIETIGGPLDEYLAHGGDCWFAVVLSRPTTAARWLGDVRRMAPSALVVFDTLDLHHVREFRHAKLTGSAPRLAHALMRKRQELALIAAADRTLVVSETERELLAREAPLAEVHVVSNIHPVVEGTPPFESRNGVVFVGAFSHDPNVDGAEWLADELWPLVRQAAPIELTIVGLGAPESLARPYGVTVASSVPDVAPYFDGARLSVAPLRFGAGVKGKVLESLGRGTPVVGTSVAFEGIAIDGAPVADDASALAQAIVAVHDDLGLWTALQHEGRRVVEESFSVSAASRALGAALRPGAVHA